ncbi:MAG: UDP-N-acetylmuramyl-tripeptide synthetase [Patescibacteria group bacterium]|nr:UDP-N-acetylmuramyl-tripeptide synthetase [Patescibacteria group bacterium]MDE1966366.1 UDP-N-acetylmuramyl-tripeptide synthetase [Patescibacteria group bacterium]
MSRLYRTLVLPYHFLWAFLSAAYYGFPAKKLTVIGVTGTKGKSSVSEMLYAVLTDSGHTAALAGTIRFAIGAQSEPNLYKMTLPGHGFIQRFLARAVREGATHAIVELTSEGALQYRHAFLSLDALIFTNLQEEHLESHGSFEKYFRAKFRIARALARSGKRPRAIIANAGDPRGKDFLALPVEDRLPFSFSDAAAAVVRDDGVSFLYRDTRFDVPHPGRFTVMNALAVIRTSLWLGIPVDAIARALAAVKRIAGRAERIEAGQDFIAVVDYAHTPDSLRAIYGAYKDRRKVCVLGNTGGGRDVWKRPLMGGIADEACAEVFLTDEDPYDENPESIVEAMAKGMKRAPRIIMDRREAIRAALRAARAGDAVLITGKGTDPFIMRAKGAKEPWSDARVVREELERLRTES